MSLNTKLTFAFLGASATFLNGCDGNAKMDQASLRHGTCETVERQKFTAQKYQVRGDYRSDPIGGYYVLTRVPEDGKQYRGTANCLEDKTEITQLPISQIQP